MPRSEWSSALRDALIDLWRSRNLLQVLSRHESTSWQALLLQGSARSVSAGIGEFTEFRWLDGFEQQYCITSHPALILLALGKTTAVVWQETFEVQHPAMLGAAKREGEPACPHVDKLVGFKAPLEPDSLLLSSFFRSSESTLRDRGLGPKEIDEALDRSMPFWTPNHEIVILSLVVNVRDFPTVYVAQARVRGSTLAELVIDAYPQAGNRLASFVGDA